MSLSAYRDQSEQTTAGARKQSRLTSGLSVSILLCVSFGFGGYFVLRYAGLWMEHDTSVFVQSIIGMRENARLDYPGAYSHGFGYIVWSTFLGEMSGLATLDMLQRYLPIVGNLFLVCFGFLAYRRLLASDRLGLFAAALLPLVPELVFTVSRGNHEKLTATLTLVAITALLMSFVELHKHRRWRVFTAWVVVMYSVNFTLISLNAFFGSSFIFASTLALAFAFIAMRFRLVKTEENLSPIVKRLVIVVSTGWLLVALVSWYVYPSAGRILNVVNTAAERVAVVVLSATTESDPYAVIGTDWVNQTTYTALSSFRWTLFAVSFLCWVVLLVFTIKRKHSTPLNYLFLLALYGAFGFQVAAAIPVDFSNTVGGTNLQVRMYTYFALISPPLFVIAVRFFRQRFLRHISLRILFVGVMCFFAGLSLLKATLDPTVSNRWLFYDRQEVEAVRFWDRRHQYQSLWTDPDARLRAVYRTLFYDANDHSNVFDAASLAPNTTHALYSRSIAANAVAFKRPGPFLWLENRTYDNGEAQIYHRIPRTPFQR